MGKIKLEFTPRLGTKGVKIYRNDVEIHDMVSVTIGEINTWTDLTSPELVTVEYKVRSYNTDDVLNTSDSDGNTESIIPTEVDQTAPSIPQNTRVHSVSGTVLQITADSSTDNVAVIGYKLYQDGILNETKEEHPLTYITAQNPTLDGHLYTISAYDFEGNESVQSVGVHGELDYIDVTAPSIPQNLMETNKTDETFTLSWDASTDDVLVAGYKVYKDNGIYSDVGNILLINISGLITSSTSNWTVSAYDAVGNESNKSTSLSVTLVDSIPPGKVTTLHTTEIAETSVKLAWESPGDNVGVVGYDIYKNGIKLTDTSNITIELSGLIAGETNQWQVQAFDLAGNFGEISDMLSVTHPDSTIPPDTVIGLTVSNLVESGFDLTWNASQPDVQGYRISKNGITFLDVGNVITYNIIDEVVGSSSDWTISAYNSLPTYSAESDSVTVQIPDETAPSKVTGLNYTNITGTSMTLSWASGTDNLNVTGYIVNINGILHSDVGNVVTVDISNIVDGSTNDWTVFAYDSTGNISVVSDILTVNQTAIIYPLDGELVSYYKFDESSGTVATDEIGSVDGTLTNATFQTTGVLNNTVYCETGSVNFGDNFDFVYNEPKSFNFWYKTTTEIDNRYPFMKSNPGFENYIRIKYNFSDIYFQLYGNNSAIGAFITTNSISENTWHMITITTNGDYTANNFRIYIDGNYLSFTLVSRDDLSSSSHLEQNNGEFELNGNLGTSQIPSAYLDEFGVWNRELTQSDVTELYNSGNGKTYPFV